jgi:hypothetical protein
LLNWAARYYPIIRTLKAHALYDSGSLLEIGSGPIGIGRFRNVPFVGCDISFPSIPKPPMTPVVASAAELPFKDNEFDVVLASDVLEHIPTELRQKVISEALRVARKLVIFGFPCGELAWKSDQDLMAAYVRSRRTPPAWLSEHLEAAFPEPDVFNPKQIDGWDLKQFGNESIAFHSWMMRREMSLTFVIFSSGILRLAPTLVEFLLGKADAAPFYRQIFALNSRESR